MAEPKSRYRAGPVTKGNMVKFGAIVILFILSVAIRSAASSNAITAPSLGARGPSLAVTTLKPATAKELRRWENAAAHGDAKAENQLAWVALQRHDYAEAAKFAQQSAFHGCAAGEATLGMLYLAGWGVPQNYGAAQKWFHAAAALEYAPADLELGIIYQRGWGVPRDYVAAAQWFRIAAGKGNSDAQFDLGSQYRNGLGVQQNYRKAVAWYRRAAIQGSAVGESGLGDMFALGQGAPRDYPKALFWYRKAAGQGNADAENGIGILYTKGLGVHRNYSTAMRYFRKAAAGGYAVAMQNIGMLYLYGHGVPQNFSTAEAWFRRAIAAGDTGAKAELAWIRRAEIENLLSWVALAAVITGAIWWLRRRLRRSSNGGDADKRGLPYVARAKRWGDIWIVILIPCEFVALRPMLVGNPLVGVALLLLGLTAIVILSVWAYKTSRGMGARTPRLWALLIFVPVINLFVLLRMSSNARKWLLAGGAGARLAE